MIDFATLELSKTANFYLVCPPGLCPAPAQRAAPVYDVSAPVLRELWLKILSREDRMTMVSWDDDRLECEFVQRSAVFKFPDRISVRFMPEGTTRSTLAVYGRSVFGTVDFGVNKRRIERWLALLSQEAAAAARK